MDIVYASPVRTITEFQPSAIGTAMCRPVATDAGRDPEPSGLTLDEIRRIVFDLLG